MGIKNWAANTVIKFIVLFIWQNFNLMDFVFATHCEIYVNNTWNVEKLENKLDL